MDDNGNEADTIITPIEFLDADAFASALYPRCTSLSESSPIIEARILYVCTVNAFFICSPNYEERLAALKTELQAYYTKPENWEEKRVDLVYPGHYYAIREHG